MPTVPDYIEQRIRRPVPADSCVVPGSTPVVAFGDARAATVATLGLNPSRKEFLDEIGVSNELRTALAARVGRLANPTDDSHE